MPDIRYESKKDVPIDALVALYTSLGWSSAEKPAELQAALANSHAVVTAWDGERLVGLGNAISDGHLVVYYPHLLVQPDYQRRGIGTKIVRRLQERYDGLHQQTVIADGGAIDFYQKLGFTEACGCQALWVYDGEDHE
jgi:GNAT superfamily N-acetyltransferase